MLTEFPVRFSSDCRKRSTFRMTSAMVTTALAKPSYIVRTSRSPKYALPAMFSAVNASPTKGACSPNAANAVNSSGAPFVTQSNNDVLSRVLSCTALKLSSAALALSTAAQK